VWSCKTCWAVFHRTCIKKWASHSLGEGTVWRCPGCQTPTETVPQEYRCWCGKVENPEVDRLATPHSCTQPCLRQRKSGCQCMLPCHPGPCPPCFQVHRPPETCFCGRDTRVVKCVDYDPDSPGWSCGQPCSTPLNCNAAEVALSDGEVDRHTCQVVCHAGPCPPCDIKETVLCYCGKHDKEIACSDKDFPKSSHVDGDEPKSWLGFYQCGDVCERYVPFTSHDFI
jgi:transcriptional repressor NF-X1